MLRLLAISGLGLSGLGSGLLFLLVWVFGYEYENSDVGRGEWLLLLLVVGAGSLAALVATYGVATLSRRPALVGTIGQAAAVVSLIVIGAVEGRSMDGLFAAVLALVLLLDAAVAVWAWPSSRPSRGSSAPAG